MCTKAIMYTKLMVTLLVGPVNLYPRSIICPKPTNCIKTKAKPNANVANNRVVAMGLLPCLTARLAIKKVMLLSIIITVLVIKALGRVKSVSQSGLELLTTTALVKPANDMVREMIPNQSIIFFALIFFSSFVP